MGAITNYLPLFKLRICSLITFSAVVGFISAGVVNVSFSSLVLLVFATMLASAGASAFNHYFDMDIDALMPRTKARPIPSGGVTDGKVVLALAVILLAISLAVSSLWLNYMVGLHLLLGALTYAILYTAWLKRRSWVNIIIGGLAGSFAVLAGGASATPELCAAPVLLAITMFFWTPSHFWSFAILHREEYEKAGVPMLPNVIGDSRTARWILLNTAVLVLSSFLPFFFGYLGAVYAAVAVAVGIYFLAMNLKLIRSQSKEIAKANFRASMVYLGCLFMAVIADAYLPLW
ncbi:MAG: heme o synthase [Deltaproteobacteria bacterium]